MSAGAGGGGAGAIVRQGHLRKLKTMKKKYFVLRAETQDCSARLEYYESEKKFRAGAAPRRVLPLKSCYNITRRLDLKQKHVIALFTREEQFCIVAENEQDLHAWLTAILKQHRSDDASEELLHPIQHVWQVNVQKKGLGSSKNIQGLYNLCLTDKTLTLVKIKSHNNVISNLDIPERIEYTLKNIRRCGDSECFFYMEVGRQTSTGAGELWMHSDDSNIAQSMHSTIYLAMRNCAKESENERDHIILPVEGAPRRSHSYSQGSSGSRPALSNDAGSLRSRSDSMPSRTCPSFEPERPVPRHSDLEVPDMPRDETDGAADWYRTPGIPEEPDCVDVTRDFISSGGRVGGAIPIGASIHHSRTSSLGADDSVPDGYLPMAPGHDPLPALISASSGSVCSGTPSTDPRFSSGGRIGALPAGASIHHSRTSSVGTEPDGYLPMAPGHDPLPALVSASSGSVCSGTPSTDPRFCEYQLEPATSHIVEGERPPRAWSVGSRNALGAAGGGSARERHRAYSVGARCRPSHAPHPRAPTSAPLLPRASAEDLMELDFSANSPQAKVIVSQTPPSAGFAESRTRANVDEYVDMSPRNAAFLAPRPNPPPPPATLAPATHAPITPDGYVEMNYTRAPTRPIAITGRSGSASGPVAAAAMPASSASPPRRRDPRTPLGSQTIFPISLDSPASPPDLDATDDFEDDLKDEPSHPLTTVREISEEGGRRSPEAGLGAALASSPQYVRLALAANPTAHKTLARPLLCRAVEASSTATVVVAGARGAAAARFSVGAAGTPPATPPPTPTPGAEPLHYAALDLQPRRAPQPKPPRTYTQIDFVRSEKLHAADGT